MMTHLINIYRFIYTQVLIIIIIKIINLELIIYNTITKINKFIMDNLQDLNHQILL